jgi:HEAT repeat protein
LFALEHDPNAGVRQRAMLGLRRYTKEPAVQNALAEVLLDDSDASMRTQAIDLLNSHGTAELDRRIVGALQEVMSREDDVYVRERAGRMLRAIKASLDIY